MAIMNSVRRGIKNPKKALAVVSHKLLSAVGNNQYRRFIVLSRSRTGSNLLISLLNSHPHIYTEREIFGKLSGRNYVKAKGFKIFYYHPLDDDSCSIWDELQSLDDLYVIHLKRRNILRTLLSRKTAGIQDVWSVGSDRHSSCREQISVSFTNCPISEGREVN